MRKIIATFAAALTLASCSKIGELLGADSLRISKISYVYNADFDNAGLDTKEDYALSFSYNSNDASIKSITYHEFGKSTSMPVTYESDNIWAEADFDGTFISYTYNIDSDGIVTDSEVYASDDFDDTPMRYTEKYSYSNSRISTIVPSSSTYTGYSQKTYTWSDNNLESATYKFPTYTDRYTFAYNKDTNLSFSLDLNALTSPIAKPTVEVLAGRARSRTSELVETITADVAYTGEIAYYRFAYDSATKPTKICIYVSTDDDATEQLYCTMSITY